MCLIRYTIQQIQIKLGWALFVTYTIIQSIMRSEMCSLHLTHPSVHTWSSGQPTMQRPGSSRGLPVGAGIRTHNLGLPQVSSPTLYPLGQRLPSTLLTTQYILKWIGLLVCSDRVMDSGGGNNAKCKYNNFSSIYCLVINHKACCTNVQYQHDHSASFRLRHVSFFMICKM